ncbi:MAG: hypothetical protein CM1200mP40_10580 [Gammaproteobacteria bacterium]|nr:MAG: hypothetical protein CM1200mP40_10580 [Gammaproteobacteria bacterium]
MPRLHPDRCLGVIGLNTSAARPTNLPPAEDSEPSLIIMTPRYYFATFQQPGYAEEILGADVRKTFDFILSRGGIWDAEAFAQIPEDSGRKTYGSARHATERHSPWRTIHV